ncbi:MAG: hypothetical protein ACLP7Q_14595 [Isosphaeraceae bacterium]
MTTAAAATGTGVVMLEVPRASRFALLAALSPSDRERLRLGAVRAASKWPKVWSRFGRFLPSHAREKFLEPDLAEHTSDFFEALSTAGTRAKQNLLIVSFTIAALGKVLACTGAAFRRRLGDEFDTIRSRLM